MNESNVQSEYQWYGLHRVKPTRPPYIVERRPYDTCPQCKNHQYRAIYDGRTESSYSRCKHCKYETERDLEPERYVSDGGKREADFLLVVFALVALVGIASLVYKIGVAVL